MAHEMNLKEELLAALHDGGGSAELLDIVQRHESSAGMQSIYDTLQGIWVDFGFDHQEGGGFIRDELEYVMGKVWYQCPETEARP